MTDTTDRELLELAAKAGGVELGYWCPNNGAFWCGEYWNPLDDDGDNRRLQIDLKIELIITDQAANACFDWVFYSEPLGKNARKAARRAVVRAAAEIGRGMK